MSRKPSTDEAFRHPSRREFLLAGGSMITTLTLERARPSLHQTVSEERERIRALMKRYGSELGDARYVEKR